MEFYLEPVNLKQWHMFNSVKEIGHIETFLATKDMEIGDIMFLYVGKQDKSYVSGVYAIGEIVKKPYIYTGNPSDYCYGKNSVDVKITYINYTTPFATEDEVKLVNKQFRTVHKLHNVAVLLNIIKDRVTIPSAWNQAKQRILFCNVAYMRYYDVDIVDDVPVNGGSYVKENKDALEKYNFHKCKDGVVRGFVETKYVGGYKSDGKAKQIHIENIDDDYVDKEEIENVLVVFCAKLDTKGTVIVGWYKDATVLREREQYDERDYNIYAKAENCVLLAENDRTFQVPRAKTSKEGIGFGQANVWYANDDKADGYVKSVFAYIEGQKAEPITEFDIEEEYFEDGKGKKSVVNHYERNPQARRVCLEKNGTACKICGFDAGEIYGEAFKGKIHVHHIVPIHLRDDKYKVNPEKDLIPICPNCHMIIHTKINGNYLSVDELKSIVKGNR